MLHPRQAKAAQLRHAWVSRYVPDNWLGRDGEAAQLLTRLLQLCQGLSLLRQRAVERRPRNASAAGGGGGAG